MTLIIIITVVGLLIYFLKRKKGNSPFDTEDSSITSTVKTKVNLTQQKFQSKISELPFADRIDAIVWHIKAIENGLANGNLDHANLSYAKLIESIRQQNITENGIFEDHLQKIKKERERVVYLNNDQTVSKREACQCI